jgi:hypothetical protein
VRRRRRRRRREKSILEEDVFVKTPSPEPLPKNF